MERVLAEREDGGRGAVSVCGSCADVHVRWGNLVLTLEREAFGELVRVLSDAAERLEGARGWRS